MKSHLSGKIISLLILASIPALGYPELDINGTARDTDLFDGKKIPEKVWEVPESPSEIKPQEMPSAEIEQSFFIKKINLVGVESFSPKDFATLVEQYENKQLTLSELNVLAKGIEEKYLERGIIAAVFVPPQEIREETIAVQVVEAKMGELDIQEHKHFDKERIRYYWRIPPGETLRFENISRSVQMMNKNPDRKVKVNLRAGKTPGTTDVVLGADTKLPFHLTWSADREGTALAGRYKNTFGVRHNNFLGVDDMFLAGYSFGREFSGMYGYHNVPISHCGTYALYGCSLSRSNPKKDYEPFGIHAEALNASLSFHQDFFRRDRYLGEIFFGGIAKDKATKINAGTYSRDRLRILNLGGNLIFQNIISSSVFTPQLFQGIDGFGASSKGNPFASRGASTVFTKFNFKAQHKRQLPLKLEANIKFDSQVSSTKLMPQEEFGVGGVRFGQGLSPRRLSGR